MREELVGACLASVFASAPIRYRRSNITGTKDKKWLCTVWLSVRPWYYRHLRSLTPASDLQSQFIISGGRSCPGERAERRRRTGGSGVPILLRPPPLRGFDRPSVPRDIHLIQPGQTRRRAHRPVPRSHACRRRRGRLGTRVDLGQRPRRRRRRSGARGRERRRLREFAQRPARRRQEPLEPRPAQHAAHAARAAAARAASIQPNTPQPRAQRLVLRVEARDLDLLLPNDIVAAVFRGLTARARHPGFSGAVSAVHGHTALCTLGNDSPQGQLV